jgi:hypothetical protein
MADVTETESIAGHTGNLPHGFREHLNPLQNAEGPGERIETALLSLDVVSGQLPGEFEGVANGIGPQFDLVFGVVARAFTAWQARQSDRQGEQVE